MKNLTPAGSLFWAVLMRFKLFTVAPIRHQECPFGGQFEKQLDLTLKKALGRNLHRCVLDGGCFGHLALGPDRRPCGGPGEFHYGNPSARERAELQKTVMAVVAAFLGEAEDVMRLHADESGEVFTKAAAEFDKFVTPALKAKAAVIRQQFGA